MLRAFRIMLLNLFAVKNCGPSKRKSRVEQMACRDYEGHI